MKLPVLMLDNSKKLIESSFIFDYLDEEVLVGQCLTPATDSERLQI